MGGVGGVGGSTRSPLTALSEAPLTRAAAYSTMYSSDLRWLVVLKRLIWREDESTVREDIGASPSTQDRILKSFRKTGGVGSEAAGASRRGRARELATAEMDMRLLAMAHKSKMTLAERSATLIVEGGMKVHAATVCKALRRLQLSRQRVRSEPVSLNPVAPPCSSPPARPSRRNAVAASRAEER